MKNKLSTYSTNAGVGLNDVPLGETGVYDVDGSLAAMSISSLLTKKYMFKTNVHIIEIKRENKNKKIKKKSKKSEIDLFLLPVN